MSYTKLTDFAAKDALLSGNPSKLLRGTEIGAEFDAIESAMAAAEAVMAAAEAVNITAPIIAASTSKTTPVDADVLPILDSAAANILKKVTWTNIKAALKTYFDTLYAAVGSFAASGANADITSLSALTSINLPPNTVVTADIADAQVTPAKLSQPFTFGAVVSTTFGTAIDFTGLPPWAKRVTVSFSGVSTNGSSNLLMRLGADSVETTGYFATSCTNAGAGGSATDSFSNGFSLTHATGGSAANALSGTVSFTLMNASTNRWACHGVLNSTPGGAIYTLAGVKALSGALASVRLTTNSGTDVFDTGSSSITWE